MIFYRLLKDTPTEDAGRIYCKLTAGFQEVYMPYGPDYGFLEKSIAPPRESLPVETVEDQPVWFEKVEQIFVRAKNAKDLKQLDDFYAEDVDAQRFSISEDGTVMTIRLNPTDVNASEDDGKEPCFCEECE